MSSEAQQRKPKDSQQRETTDVCSPPLFLKKNKEKKPQTVLTVWLHQTEPCRTFLQPGKTTQKSKSITLKICPCSCEDSATFWPKQLNIQVQNAGNINSVLVFYTTAYTVQSRTEATAGESLVSRRKKKLKS